MSVFPSSQATIDLQVLPTFPANVVATGAVDISKSGLTYTFGLNFQNVIEETNVSDMSKRELLAQDTDTGAFWRIKLSNLPTGQTDWANIQNKPATFPPSPHTHPVAEISDATVIGRNLVTAADAAAARTAIGAVNKAGDAMTGTLWVPTTLFVNAANASESPAVRLMDESGVRRGTVYWDRALNQVWLVLHDATGALVNSIRLSATGATIGTSPIWTNANKQIADGQVLGNVSGSTGVPVGVTLSALLDKISNTRGAVLHRGASGWAALGAGTAGQVLTSGGAGADPSWQTPSGPDALSFSVLAMQVADLANQALFLGDSGNRIFDSFATLDYVDVAGATNLDTSTPGELKPALVETVVTIGTVSTSAALGGNTAFDRSTAVPNGVTITKIGVYSTAARTVNVKIARRNSATSIDIVVDQSFAHPGSGWADVTLTSPYVVPPTGSYYIGAYATSNPIEVTANSPRILIGGQNPGVGTGIATTEDNAQNYVLRYTRADPANMTVASTAFTAASAPASEKITARIIAVDPVTLNTDLMMDVSRDGGTTWTQVTLAERFTQPGSVKVIESDSVDVSGQPSGVAPRWRIRTANNKMVEILDMALYWK